jgi:hypothetical protein
MPSLGRLFSFGLRCANRRSYYVFDTVLSRAWEASLFSLDGSWETCHERIAASHQSLCNWRLLTVRFLALAGISSSGSCLFVLQIWINFVCLR